MTTTSEDQPIPTDSSSAPTQLLPLLPAARRHKRLQLRNDVIEKGSNDNLHDLSQINSNRDLHNDEAGPLPIKPGACINNNHNASDIISLKSPSSSLLNSSLALSLQPSFQSLQNEKRFNSLQIKSLPSTSIPPVTNTRTNHHESNVTENPQTNDLQQELSQIIKSSSIPQMPPLSSSTTTNSAMHFIHTTVKFMNSISNEIEEKVEFYENRMDDLEVKLSLIEKKLDSVEIIDQDDKSQ
mmetsp:Transcript_19530/g.22131  ORF Transcript_19530/g.22131 Transcript_19530/m.22131 type:complete len:240 (+) Transcript_19530:322-1041(+)